MASQSDTSLFLSTLSRELLQQGDKRGQDPLTLKITDSDQVICSRLQLGVVGNSTLDSSPLGWLLRSLSRIEQLRDGRYRVVGTADASETLDKIEDVLTNYLLTMLSIPGVCSLRVHFHAGRLCLCAYCLLIRVSLLSSLFSLLSLLFSLSLSLSLSFRFCRFTTTSC